MTFCIYDECYNGQFRDDEIFEILLSLAKNLIFIRNNINRNIVFFRNNSFKDKFIFVNYIKHFK